MVYLGICWFVWFDLSCAEGRRRRAKTRRQELETACNHCFFEQNRRIRKSKKVRKSRADKSLGCHLVITSRSGTLRAVSMRVRIAVTFANRF
jgi:hypothetical protein